MSKKIKSVETWFLAPSKTSFAELCKSFELLWPKKAELTPQKMDRDQAQWATGWIEHEKVHGHVHLANTRIEDGNTPHEQDRARQKDGNSDLYQIKILDLSEQGATALIAIFLKHIGGRDPERFAGGPKYYIWEDLMAQTKRTEN